jgi:hypothetical protein
MKLLHGIVTLALFAVFALSADATPEHLYYKYHFENDQVERVATSFFDSLPEGLLWDLSFSPVATGSLQVDAVDYINGNRDARIDELLLPPGKSTLTLRTQATGRTGEIRNNAKLTPLVPGLEPLNAEAAITLDDSSDPGLDGGHLDVDTSSFISSIGNGSTDGHVHEYDNKYDVSGVDYFNTLNSNLHEITRDISNQNQKFKLIVANAGLSIGARLVINNTYVSNNASTYVAATTWDDIELADLPVFSLSGAAGSTKLEKLAIYFGSDAIQAGGVLPTNTGDVKKNVLGKNGEWRNGALTIQAVAVNSDGSDAFATDNGKSNGGVQGVATSGLLWESTIFYHWDGPSYHVPGNKFVPGQPPVNPE